MNKKDFGLKLKKLFFTFLKIGAFTFGGGYAMIPLIHKEIVETHKWISDEEMLDMFAIAEATPGVIAINTATFVGYHVAGFWGAVLSTLGVTLPSLFIIILISFFYEQFKHLKLVEYAFQGIRAGVVLLIFGAVSKFYKVCPKNAFNFTIMAVVFILTALFDLNAIYQLLAAALVGITFMQLNKNKEDKQ